MNFTPDQLRAIETDSREVLVIAGAGSGKTRVTTERIRRLIRDGGCASDFLVLTFTRKAAAEMRSRIGQGLHEDGWKNPHMELRAMLLGTFHAMALRMLRQDGDKIGYQRESLTVVSPADADLLLIQVSRDLGFLRSNNKWSSDLSFEKLSNGRERLYTGQITEEEWSGHVREILTEYRARLFGLNALDFGSILIECQRLLSGVPEVLERYRTRIKHVFVDELQDTDRTQFNLHDFFSPPGSFFGVGDFRQSIYGFRGARPDLVVERHAAAEVIQLRECFRCGDRIVEAANRLIAHNHDAHSADPMVGATGRAGTVAVVMHDDAALALEVKRSHEDHCFAWSDIAVMARSHNTLADLEESLDALDIPYHRVGAGFAMCDSPRFLCLHAAMRLVVNARDDLAFMRIYPWFDLTLDQYAALRRIAADAGCSCFEAMSQMPGDLYRLLMAAADDPDATPLTKYLPAIAAHGRLESEAQFWLERCGEMSIRQALNWYATRDAQDDLAAGDCVTLLTIHAAKGLEWPLCYVVDVEEGKFPSRRSIRAGEVEEERRVCYVAFTRSKECLIVHHRPPDEEHPRRQGSRFVGESLGLCEGNRHVGTKQGV